MKWIWLLIAGAGSISTDRAEDQCFFLSQGDCLGNSDCCRISLVEDRLCISRLKIYELYQSRFIEFYRTIDYKRDIPRFNSLTGREVCDKFNEINGIFLHGNKLTYSCQCNNAVAALLPAIFAFFWAFFG